MSLLNDHPLKEFLYALCAEYDRSIELHGDWVDIDDEEQISAILGEGEEVYSAYERNEVKGEHGQMKELVQLANCCGKRFNFLMAKEGL